MVDLTWMLQGSQPPLQGTLQEAQISVWNLYHPQGLSKMTWGYPTKSWGVTEMKSLSPI